ncbi:uncharacterized protein [Halyomorpha halys]|uniref:uncharacterized protein n=1 Tax=Halyomorpha halys TaxID=286706 RepID=UPI0006D4DC3E|nr:uncharacterized protein LOC106682293 [Halyomorpha halys]
MEIVKWKLSKHARWEEGNWKLTRTEPNKILALMIQELQLMVLHGDVVLESLFLAPGNKMIKSVYRNGTLVIAVKCQDSILKFRVLFSSHFDGEECASFLEKYMEVGGSEGPKSGNITLPEMLAKCLKEDIFLPAPESITSDFPLEDAVKLCILDPGFSKLVARIEKIINEMSEKEKQ